MTCVVAILRLSVDTFAINLMGPPTVTHEALQVSIGLEYSYSEENLELSDHGVTGLNKLNDVRNNELIAKLGVGLLYNWELFLCVGTSALRINEIDFDGSTDFVRGIGTKVTFYRSDRFDLGALFQWSIYGGDETGFTDAVGYYAEETIDVDEQHIAIGATMHMDGWRLYGGPFYYVFDGDVTIKEAGRPANQVRPDLEEGAEYGAYVGGQFDLGETTYLTVGYTNTGEGWGMGIGLSRMF